MYTNSKIPCIIAEQPDEMKNSNKYSYIKEVTETELLAFWGFIMQELGQNLVYAAIMSYNRMLFINSMITFDDHECRSYHWKLTSSQQSGLYSKCSISPVQRPCRLAILMPSTRHYIQHVVVSPSKGTIKTNQPSTGLIFGVSGA